MHAAQRFGIPVINLDQPPFICSSENDVIQHGLVQFGLGEKQSVCKGAWPQSIALEHSPEKYSDRVQLFSLLRDSGIPIPAQDFEFLSRNQVRRAQRSAQRIGYPVTVRPRVNQAYAYRFNENYIFSPVINDEQVAFVVSHFQRNVQADIWVEQYIEGDKFRFLIIGGEVVSIIQSLPPEVIGDAEHSIEWLASEKALHGSDLHDYRLWRSMAIGDEDAKCRLALSGLTLDSVLSDGATIALRDCGTHYNGGSCRDMTGTMPMVYSDIALETAEISDCSYLAEITMTINDLSAGGQANNCAVADVSLEPDLNQHIHSSSSGNHTLIRKFFDLLLPIGDTGRIPIISITGTNGKTTTSRMVSNILMNAGFRVGLACTDGVYIGGEQTTRGDSSGIMGACEVFVSPKVNVAVLETARGNMANSGIAFDQCDIGVCLNVAEDHIGYEGIDSLDEMAIHKRQVIERAVGTAVLNADDPRCLDMMGYSRAKSIVLIAKKTSSPAVVSHCQNGGMAIVVDSNGDSEKISIYDSNGIHHLLDIKEIPATMNGLALHNVENAMFAIAVSLGMGVNKDVVIDAMRQFSMSHEETPGRLVTYDKLPFNVILDVAHNSHGVKYMCKFTSRLKVKGRRILLFGTPGQRRSDEIKSIASEVAGNFSYYICREPFDPRGREQGEVVDVLESTLIEHGVHKDRVDKFTDYEEALTRSLTMAQKDDLLVILTGSVYSQTLKAVEEFYETAQYPYSELVKYATFLA